MNSSNIGTLRRSAKVVDGERLPPYLASVKADPEIQANALLTEMSSSLEFGKVYLKGNANATTINNDVLFPMLERIMNGADVKTELAQAQDAISMIIGQ